MILTAKYFKIWNAPAGILLLCLLSYGLNLPGLGYYLDDWIFLWAQNYLDQQHFIEFINVDRPTSYAYWHLATSRLFGVNPLAWHVFAIISRLLTIFGFWWMMRELLPRYRTEVIMTTFLFAIYPGISIISMGLIYSHYFLELALVLFSFAATVASIRHQKKFWLYFSIAWITYTISATYSEYFTGLELLRPVMIWIVLKKQQPDWKKRIPIAIRYWLPYLTVWLAYLVYRFLVFHGTRESTSLGFLLSQFRTDPLLWCRYQVNRAIGDLLSACFIAWGRTVQPFLLVRSTFLVTAGAFMTTFFLLWFSSRITPFSSSVGNGTKRPRFPHSKIIPSLRARDFRMIKSARLLSFGLLAVILGMLPVWLTNGLMITLGCANDRFALPAMLGGVLVMGGIIFAVSKPGIPRIGLISLVIACSVGYHFHLGRLYRDNWQQQKSLYWQLRWRIPNLTPNTALLLYSDTISSQEPEVWLRNYSLGAALNFIYPNPAKPQTFRTEQEYLDYFVFKLSDGVMAENPVKTWKAAPSQPLEGGWRTLHFSGRLDSCIVMMYEPPGSLRLLDRRAANLTTLPSRVRRFAPFSSLNLIQPPPGNPSRIISPLLSEKIFGDEPEHLWSYYYQKAELAKQFDNWAEVVRLGEQVVVRGFRPAVKDEAFVFIEGAHHVGRTALAKEFERWITP